MPMHQTIFVPKSTNSCRIEIGSERLKCNMQKSSGLIPTGRLGKPPCQHFVPDKKLGFSSSIYLLLLLLYHFSPVESFSIQSQIKDLLKMVNISTDHKRNIYVYASDNLFSQINKLVLKQDRVKKTKKKHAHNL